MADTPKSKQLDWQTKQVVKYCIPLWLRDEHIKLAIAKVKGRIEPCHEMRQEPIAVVGFGPSLRTTWESIREFKHIITCSGSHKFLLEKGIIPTWHVEVDPRPHKVELLGPPHPDVVYLPASTCSPRYFDHLEGFQVKLWHIFANETEAIRTLPRGEWAITGGPDVGMRAMILARFFGFTDLQVFGMDGCAGPEEISHATFHPNSPKKYATCEYEGKTYLTTPALLECAKAVWHELDMMKDVRATFHGEGLVQAMAKNYKPNHPKTAILAVNNPELISAPYRDLNARLHRENLAYGVGGERHAPTILKLSETLKTKNILDYGCGKGRLGTAIPWQIAEYDPAIAGKEELPKPADIVSCTDVLEHIEPDKLLFVLEDLRRCVRQVGYFTIHTGPAQKTLADGRNTHLIQQDKKWWAEQLAQFFEVGKIIEAGVELHIVVGPKHRKQKRVPMSVVPELQPAEAS